MSKVRSPACPGLGWRILHQECNPDYPLQLCQVLHPEGKDATESGLNNVTINNVLMDQMYNNLAFVANNRLLIMIEAQSTWSDNIVARMLLHLAEK